MSATEETHTDVAITQLRLAKAELDVAFESAQRHYFMLKHKRKAIDEAINLLNPNPARIGTRAESVQRYLVNDGPCSVTELVHLLKDDGDAKVTKASVGSCLSSLKNQGKAVSLARGIWSAPSGEGEDAVESGGVS